MVSNHFNIPSLKDILFLISFLLACILIILFFSKLSYIPEQDTLPQAGTPVQGVRSRSCSLYWVFNLGC